MITNLFLSLFLLILSGFFFAESETILMYQSNHSWKPKPWFPEWPWYVEQNYLYQQLVTFFAVGNINSMSFSHFSFAKFFSKIFNFIFKKKSPEKINEEDFFNFSLLQNFILFLLKYPFAFIKSGFHFTKSFAIVLFIISIHLLALPLFLSIFVGYLIFGLGFNIGYHN